ncbi:MAG: imidazole glycerol phosphate synthase subunit HisH [Sediminibacterium sp.]
MKKITVIDYGIGNVKSITNALESIEVSAVLTSDKDEILNADGVILPGVGAFKHGMDNLFERDLVDTLRTYVDSGRLFLGVCLGMQMLMEESEEFGITRGLGFIEGKVIRMPLDEKTTEKLPHVSWNELVEPTPGRWKGTILEGLPAASDAYFVHSFVALPSNQDNLLAACEYGNKLFCAAVHKNNVYGTQFHPEKSGNIGKTILKNFLSLI